MLKAGEMRTNAGVPLAVTLATFIGLVTLLHYLTVWHGRLMPT